MPVCKGIDSRNWRIAKEGNSKKGQRTTVAHQAREIKHTTIWSKGEIRVRVRGGIRERGRSEIRERGRREIRERGRSEIKERGRSEIRERGRREIRERGRSVRE